MLSAQSYNTQASVNKLELKACEAHNAHLLHDIQLRVLGLKELDEQLEDLRVQQLVTRTDLCRENFNV